jgi:hypothetical protein
LNCINNLKVLQTHNPITLNWIRAHKTHPGNELADLLAKMGTLITPSTLASPPMSFLLISTPLTPNHTLKTSSIKSSKKIFRQKWKKSAKYRQAKLFFPTTAPRKSFSLLRLDRVVQSSHSLKSGTLLFVQDYLICGGFALMTV